MAQVGYCEQTLRVLCLSGRNQLANIGWMNMDRWMDEMLCEWMKAWMDTSQHQYNTTVSDIVLLPNFRIAHDHTTEQSGSQDLVILSSILWPQGPFTSTLFTQWTRGE